MTPFERLVLRALDILLRSKFELHLGLPAGLGPRNADRELRSWFADHAGAMKELGDKPPGERALDELEYLWHRGGLGLSTHEQIGEILRAAGRGEGISSLTGRDSER